MAKEARKEEEFYKLPEREWVKYVLSLSEDEAEIARGKRRAYFKALEEEALRQLSNRAQQEVAQKQRNEELIQLFRLFRKPKKNENEEESFIEKRYRWMSSEEPSRIKSIILNELLPRPKISHFDENQMEYIDEMAVQIFFEHCFLTLSDPVLFPIQTDLLQAENLLPFGVDQADYQTEALKEVTEALSNLSQQKLSDLQKKSLNEEKSQLEQMNSDPDFLRKKIHTLKLQIQRRNALRRKQNLSGEPKQTLDRLEAMNLEEVLTNIQNPDWRGRRVGAIDEQLARELALQNQIEALQARSESIQGQIEQDEELKKFRGLAEILQELPDLEPMYRQALAELRSADYFYPGVRIPSFIEICCTFFNLQRSRYQPEDYKPPEGLNEVMAKVIKSLKNNPELIRSIMMLGLMGHYPAVGHYDKNGFHIFTTAKDYTSIHCRNLMYDEEAQRSTFLKNNGNVKDRVAFISCEGVVIQPMHYETYFHMKRYATERSVSERLSGLRDWLKDSYGWHESDIVLHNVFDPETGIWAKGTFDEEPSQVYLNTPESQRRPLDDSWPIFDRPFLPAGAVLSASRPHRNQKLVVRFTDATQVSANTIWRASLRVLWT